MSDNNEPLFPSNRDRRDSDLYARLSFAGLQNALHKGRRRHYWMAILTLLGLGVCVFFYFIIQFNHNYTYYRSIAEGRMQINVEHRTLVPSDLNGDLIVQKAQQQYDQEVDVTLTEKGDTLLYFSNKKGKVLGKRQVELSDLNPSNIRIKYQSNFGEPAGKISLMYDSDGIAKLVVDPRDEL